MLKGRSSTDVSDKHLLASPLCLPYSLDFLSCVRNITFRPFNFSYSQGILLLIVVVPSFPLFLFSFLLEKKLSKLIWSVCSYPKDCMRSVQGRCMRHGISVDRLFYLNPRFSRTANKRDQASLVSPGKWIHRTITFYIVLSNTFHVARAGQKNLLYVMYFMYFELSNLLLLLLNMFYLCFELSYDCFVFIMSLSLFVILI